MPPMVTKGASRRCARPFFLLLRALPVLRSGPEPAPCALGMVPSAVADASPSAPLGVTGARVERRGRDAPDGDQRCEPTVRPALLSPTPRPSGPPKRARAGSVRVGDGALGGGRREPLGPL